MKRPRYLAIANPEGKRWQTYEQELRRYWDARGTPAEVLLAPWRDVIQDGGWLDRLAIPELPAAVRLESPGRDLGVKRLLIERGGRLYPERLRPLPPEEGIRKGLQLQPFLLYAGFRRTLEELKRLLDARPHLTPLACPLAVAELFDKNATADRLTAAGLPCPPSLPAPSSAAELLELLRRRRFATAYVKLNTGSSASAIAVVHPLDDPPWALSSLVRLDDGFYSTRRLCRHTGTDLHAVLTFLLAEGACIQQGIPMARLDGMGFDVRVVMIHHQPVFTIFRLSTLPMTNLHLGGRRGHTETCRAAIPRRAWLDAMDHCVEASRLYPCATLGIDLLFEQGYTRHYLLEVNAFGDFFPGLTDAEGQSVHGAEIEQTAHRLGLTGG